MSRAKLTLSVDKRIVHAGKRLARERKTSLSAMFSGYVASLAKGEREAPKDLGPLTRRASGMVRIPAGKSRGELIEDALIHKFRAGK